MVFRSLEPTDWKELKSVFDAEGAPLPNPDLASGLVVVDGGKIVGYHGLESVIHAGPAWIHPDYRGQGLWQVMWRLLDANVGGYIVLSDSERTDAMAERNGLKLLPYRIWKKE